MAKEDEATVDGTIRAFISYGKDLLTREEINKASLELHINPVFSLVVIQAYSEEVYWDDKGHIVADRKDTAKFGGGDHWKQGFRIPRKLGELGS